MMKAAAGVFFQKYTGYADACRKLSLGDPVRATPHIVYYTNKIVASMELQSALMAQHKEEWAQEAATTGAAPDNAPVNAPAAAGPATAAAANPTTPRPSGGYMGCGGTLAQYQVPGDPLPTLHPHARLYLRRRRRRRHHRRPASQPVLAAAGHDHGPCDLDRPAPPLLTTGRRNRGSLQI